MAIRHSIPADGSFTGRGKQAWDDDHVGGMSSLVSVKEAPYSAVGDGVTDDTAAIQACLTANLSNSGGGVFFPSGTYKISSSLTIGASSGWRIFGQSRGSTVIRQDTDNTPIFTLTAADTHSWNISDLRLTWNSAQASTNTSAIAIYMSGATGTAANGYYQWQVERVTFANGFRGINGNETIQLSLWGFCVDDCQAESTMSGALVRVIPSPSIGMPNIKMRNLYIRCDSMKEAAIRILGANVLVMEGIELNNGTVSASNMAAGITLTSCTDTVINGMRFEATTIASDTHALLDISGGNATVNGFEVAGAVVSSAITGYGLKVTSSGTVSVCGNSATATLSGGGAFYTFAGQTFNRLENYISSGATGSKDPSISVLYDDGGAITVSTKVLAPIGTASAPSYSFTAQTGFGLYRRATSLLGITAGSGAAIEFNAAAGSNTKGMRLASDAFVSWVDTATVDAAGANNLFIGADAAQTLAQRNGTAAQIFNHYGSFTSASRYSRLAFKHTTSTLSAVSGATATATNLIPAKANVMGVNTIVTAALGGGGGTTGYSVGDGSDADRWGAVTGTAIGTDTDGTDATADPTGWFTAANNVVITAAGGNFNGTGDIFIDVAYFITEAD